MPVPNAHILTWPFLKQSFRDKSVEKAPVIGLLACFGSMARASFDGLQCEKIMILTSDCARLATCALSQARSRLCASFNLDRHYGKRLHMYMELIGTCLAFVGG